LAERLGPVPLPPVLEQLKTLTGITPKACLLLAPVAVNQVASAGLMQATLKFDYAGHRGWWVGQGTTVLIDEPAGRCLLHRNPQAELESLSNLMALGLVAMAKGSLAFQAASPSKPGCSGRG